MTNIKDKVLVSVQKYLTDYVKLNEQDIMDDNWMVYDDDENEEIVLVKWQIVDNFDNDIERPTRTELESTMVNFLIKHADDIKADRRIRIDVIEVLIFGDHKAVLRRLVDMTVGE